MGENNGWTRLGTIVVGSKLAPQKWLYPEHREEFVRHSFVLYSGRFTLTVKSQRNAVRPGGERFERLALALPVQPVRRIHIHAGASHRAFVEHHELFATRIWQRPQKESVDDGEDGCVCADSET